VIWAGLAWARSMMWTFLVVMGGGIRGNVRACGHGGGSSHLIWVCTSFGLESKWVVPIIICKDASKFGALSWGNGAVLVAWF
jgi:hypothetical protein